MPKFVFLATDVALFALLAGLALYVWHVRRTPNLRATWRSVFRDAPAMCALVLLCAFLLLAVLDSIHFRPLLPKAEGAAADAPHAYSTRAYSVLDRLLAKPLEGTEKTYSAPLAYLQFTKESFEVDGKPVRDYPRLAFGGAHLKDPPRQRAGDIAMRSIAGLAAGAIGGLLLAALVVAARGRAVGQGFGASARAVWRRETDVPWRAILATLIALALLAGGVAALWARYHVLGTDRTGNDVLVLALKSVRTAFVIGSLATLATLPFALGFGVLAGYFRGWVDEVIQYLYTTLSSVPNVLLIAACILMVQVFLDKNPELFETGAERSDLKMFLLCAILGITGWSTLCRLIRGETLKLRELEFVQAATAFGVGPARIMGRHIVPNVMHLVLITTVLAFSDLILYEAVLTYVGVGVDPSMTSFGGMINAARGEMSRDPVVWWSFAAAFGFMVTLVLAANLFADGVRDAFDPRAAAMRPRLLRRRGAQGAGGRNDDAAAGHRAAAAGAPERAA
jgi:peptide/nickel transport system permease protein